MLLNLTSCMPTSSNSTRGRSTSGAIVTKVGITQGKVLKENPIILANNFNLSPNADLNRYVGSAVFITSNSFLRGNPNCFGLEYCFEVRENETSASALQSSDGRWGFDAHSENFLQVNTFYHLNKIFDRFFENLNLSSGYAYNITIPYYDSAIPLSMYNTNGSFNFVLNPLIAYSNCDVENNAAFDRANFTLCFGYTTNASKNLRWAHDNTIIYHEAGHFFQKLQINFRNHATVKVAELGNLLYDEAGAIGEGLSDFYSYYITGRTHFAEWAAGRILKASRPLSESDPIHAPGISTDRDQRLSYPQYITYDPNFAAAPVEDIHVSGMIISHYLVALTEDLQTKCGMTKAVAQNNVMHILNETLAELGDLTSVGTVSGAVGKVNLNATYSSKWLSTVNPINYRSFAQTIAKNLYNTLGNPTLLRCGGSFYQKDYIESLLDDYGLLLFRTYNQHRNLSNGTTKVNTSVTSTNRRKSVLIAKSSIILDPSPQANTAFVIDNRNQILSGIKLLQNSGIISAISPQTPSDLGFNNGNSKVSPGEIVAIALNLYNNSNSTMGGVQILANDWDHADTSTGKPCQFSTSLTDDTWPLESEGASTAANCNSIGASASEFAPVCFIQSNESNATKWISQKDLKEKMALDSGLCLNKDNDKDCFVRAISGADQAHYSKINPKATWGQTMADPETGEAYGLDWGNVILFEVSKHTPPGTVIDCRLRVRFTNCEDCYHDATRNNYDYFDTDYNGPKPFKIIHLQIPITD